MNIKLKVREEAVCHAVETLVMALKEDKDLYFAYQSNIAMAFYDELRKRYNFSINRMDLSEMCNQAAVNFLELLCSERGFKGKEKEE